MTDGETARDRLAALGYEFSDDESTVEGGHDGRINKRRRNPSGDPDPRLFGPTVRPVQLEVRCGAGPTGSKLCSEVLATLWAGDDDDLWAEIPLFGHVIDGALASLADEEGTVAVRCVRHGVARLSAAALRRSAHIGAGRFLLLDVTTGVWGYDLK